MPSRWQTPQQLWFRPCTRPARQTARLVCLPHAGGTAQVYRSWSPSAPAGLGVFAVQYPGRQDRFDEPFVRDVAEIVEPLATTMAPWVGEQLSIFGHSMGALLAYELTLELERRHGPVVDLLVVSGATAPQAKSSRQQVYKRSDADLIADVTRLNPTQADLFRNRDLVDLLVPMIRADYRLSETYRRPNPPRVHAAVLAVGGRSDPDVSPEDLELWSTVAGDHFDVATFPGDHFYLVEEEKALIDAIAAHLPDRQPAVR